MTLTLDVPPNLQAPLQAQAQARGLTAEDYLLSLIARDAHGPPPGSEHWTLQDALDYAEPLPEVIDGRP